MFVWFNTILIQSPLVICFDHTSRNFLAFACLLLLLLEKFNFLCNAIHLRQNCKLIQRTFSLPQCLNFRQRLDQYTVNQWWIFSRYCTGYRSISQLTVDWYSVEAWPTVDSRPMYNRRITDNRTIYHRQYCDCYVDQHHDGH